MLRADAGQVLDRLRRVVFDGLAVRVQPLGIARHILFVIQPFFQQHIAESVHQRHIAAVVELQVLVGDARGFDFARVANNDFRAVLFGFQHAARHDRVRIGAVVAEDQQAFGVFDIADGVTHRAVAERLLKTCDRRPVADAGAAVDVIGVNHRAGEFLHHVVGFVAGAARGAGSHDGARAILLFNGRQTLCGVADRLFPGDGFERAAFLVADHRLGEARRQQLGVIKEIPAVVAFKAELVLVGDAFGRLGTNDFVVIHDELEFAARTAVRTDAGDFFHQ
ncbi:hypothetical protein BN133_682 [Cronobacter dublinensis 582]|nr:hypothetical protein BN133_682 [Cronobacter dublinensis 582]